MNWDAVINIGMFVLGTCFIIVATAQLIFMDDDDDDDNDDSRHFVDDHTDEYDDDFEVITEESLADIDDEDMSLDELTYKCIDQCLNVVSEQIKEQDDPRVAFIMVDGASFATQALIDKKFNDD